MLSLSAVQAEVERLALIIGASGYALPTFGHSEDFARPHVEVDGRWLSYVVVERGQELRRVTTLELDELLFHVFQDVTSSLAGDYELAYRIEGQDFRRLFFKRQVDLLARLSPAWAERETNEHDWILRKNPFSDNR